MKFHILICIALFILGAWALLRLLDYLEKPREVELTVNVDGREYKVRKQDNPHLHPSLWIESPKRKRSK